GIEVVATIDSRKGEEVTGSSGRLGLKAITVRDAAGRSRTIACDALAVSGGWNPNVQISSHHRGRPVWDEAIAAFVPGEGGPDGLRAAGAALGVMSTHG